MRIDLRTAGIKADMHESGSGRRSKCQRIVFRLFRRQRRLKGNGDGRDAEI